MKQDIYLAEVFPLPLLVAIAYQRQPNIREKVAQKNTLESQSRAYRRDFAKLSRSPISSWAELALF